MTLKERIIKMYIVCTIKPGLMPRYPESQNPFKKCLVKPSLKTCKLRDDLLKLQAKSKTFSIALLS